MQPFYFLCERSLLMARCRLLLFLALLSLGFIWTFSNAFEERLSFFEKTPHTYLKQTAAFVSFTAIWPTSASFNLKPTPKAFWMTREGRQREPVLNYFELWLNLGRAN